MNFRGFKKGTITTMPYPISISRLALTFKIIRQSGSTLVNIGALLIPFMVIGATYIHLVLDGIVKKQLNQLEEGYTGLQGRLNISSDTETLIAIKKETTKHGYAPNLRTEIGKPLLFHFNDSQKPVGKYVRLVVLPDAVYIKRFKTRFPDIAENALVTNNVFINHFDTQANKIAGVSPLKSKEYLGIDKVYAINTGFITPDAVLFVRESQYRAITGEEFLEHTNLEFMQADTHNIPKIRQLIIYTANQSGASSVKITDMLLETRETRTMFENIRSSQLTLMLFVFVLVALVTYTAINITLSLKQKAFQIILRMGISKRELALHIILITASVLLLCLSCSYLIYLATFGKWIAVLQLQLDEQTPLLLNNLLALLGFFALTSVFSAKHVYKLK